MTEPILCECCGAVATHWTPIGGGGQFYLCADCMIASIDMGQTDPSVSAPLADEFFPIPPGETDDEDRFDYNGGCLS